MDYWKECISEALEDVGLQATEEQVNSIAYWVEGAHENYSMAHGHDCIPNPLETENKRLSKELSAEREKVICTWCCGSGRTIINSGSRSSNSECSRCSGGGYIFPKR